MRVLIADDDLAICRTLAAFLATDFETTYATEGEDALSVGVRFKPDVVIIGWPLRGVDGFDVGDCLRLLQSDLRVVLLTACPSPDLQRRIASRPNTVVLSKPCDLSQLHAVIAAPDCHLARVP